MIAKMKNPASQKGIVRSRKGNVEVVRFKIGGQDGRKNPVYSFVMSRGKQVLMAGVVWT